MVHTSKACSPPSTHAAHRDPCAGAICPAVFLIFIAQKKILSHLLFFLDVSTLRECGPRARTHRGEGGGVHALAPVFSFQNNTILQWKLRAINPFKWPNGWQTYAFASLLGG